MEPLFVEIRQERDRQDAKHGGSEHDRTHTPKEWLDLMIRKQANRAEEAVDNCNPFEYRRRLIAIAASAVAALEAYDATIPTIGKN